MVASKLLTFKYSFGFLIGVAILPGGVATIQGTAALQRAFLPVVYDFRPERVDRQLDGTVIIAGRLTRQLSTFCKYDTVTWFAKDTHATTRVVDWAALDRPRKQTTRPDGEQLWGPWSIQTELADTAIEARSDYICFGIFDTYAVLGPIELETP